MLSRPRNGLVLASAAILLFAIALSSSAVQVRAATVNITVDSSPQGSGFVDVDGGPITTPQVYVWTVGDPHTLDAQSPVACGAGCQYVWLSWSDAGPQTNVITVPGVDTTYTATFQQQFELTTASNPGGGGTTAPAGTTWQNAGDTVPVTATANGGYEFTDWAGSGSGSYTGTTNPSSVTMNGPITETANFAPTVDVTFQQTGLGGDASGTVLTVDGTPYAFADLPVTVTWIQGSPHTVSASSPIPATAGKRYVWLSWSDAGAQSHTITAPVAPTTYTMDFQTQYQVTVTASPPAGGTVSTSGGWFASGSPLSIQAVANSGYSFTGWTGTGTGGYTGAADPVTITVNGPITEAANFLGSTVSITVTSSPAGTGFVTVDGAPITTPQVFSWTTSSTHTISASSTVSGGAGIQYIYSSWSDGGSQVHAVTVPGTPATYTANFQTQYYLTMLTTYGGSVLPGSGWFNSGASVAISAYTYYGYSFYYWTGSGSGSYGGYSSPVTIAMNGPITETAYFASSLVSITVTSTPSGSGYIIVDGSSSYTPTTYNWAPGGSHLLSAASPIGCGSGCQRVWTSWSDGGAQSHSIVTPSYSTTYIAYYKTQYYLTTQALGGGSGGTVYPLSGWYDSGSQVTIGATPSSGYRFGGWTGSGSGSYTGQLNPAGVTMNGPVTEVADLSLPIPEFSAGPALVLLAALFACLYVTRRRKRN